MSSCTHLHPLRHQLLQQALAGRSIDRGERQQAGGHARRHRAVRGLEARQQGRQLCPATQQRPILFSAALRRQRPEGSR
eukprot:COSAG01_NODE_14801_length_1408_cov_3.154316_2_plen_78_part_01